MNSSTISIYKQDIVTLKKNNFNDSVLLLKLNGLSLQNIFLQFDTGIYNSVIYQNIIEEIGISFATFQNAIQNNKLTFCPSFPMNHKFVPYIYTMKDIDNVTKKSINGIIIGSIGLDFFINTRIVFDYSRSEIIFYNNEIFNSYNYHEIDKKIILPLYINKKLGYFIFDTGSNTLPIVLSNRFKKKTDDIFYKFDQLMSWGSSIDVFCSEKTHQIEILNKTQNCKLYFAEVSNAVNTFFTENNIDGVVSPQLFENCKLYFDFLNRRYTIL